MKVERMYVGMLSNKNPQYSRYKRTLPTQDWTRLALLASYWEFEFLLQPAATPVTWYGK
jgi:hypothetical protein